MHLLARRQKPGRPRAHFSSALVFQPTGSHSRECVRAKRLFRCLRHPRRPVCRSHQDKQLPNATHRGASLDEGRWSHRRDCRLGLQVAKQRRHGIIRRYYSPQVPSTTPRTCHSDGLELGPYQPGSMLGPARVCAGGSMSVLNALDALTV